MTFSPNPPVEYVAMHTRLAPDECFRRLQPLTLPWHQIMLIIPWAFSKLPVMGWVWPRGFALRKRGNNFRSMTFQPEAKAQFAVAPDGMTQMRVRLGPRRWIIIFGWFGTVYIVVFGEALMFVCRRMRNPRCQEPFGFLWPLLLPAVLLLMQIWPWGMARDERAFPIDFLKQTLEAEEVPEYPFGGESR